MLSFVDILGFTEIYKALQLLEKMQPGSGKGEDGREDFARSGGSKSSLDRFDPRVDKHQNAAQIKGEAHGFAPFPVRDDPLVSDSGVSFQRCFPISPRL